MRRAYAILAFFYSATCVQAAILPATNPQQTTAKHTPQSIEKASSDQDNACGVPVAMQVWFRPNMPVNHALFSPCDKIKEIILACINNERKRINIAVFWLTDIDIARALIAAKKRGIVIEVITDPSCLEYQYNKIDMIVESGITVYVYKKKRATGTSSDKMHEKFALFEYNLYGKKILIEGSYNYTQSANKLNCEHVVVHDNRDITNQFVREFERLKKISVAYKKTPTEVAYA